MSMRCQVRWGKDAAAIMAKTTLPIDAACPDPATSQEMLVCADVLMPARGMPEEGAASVHLALAFFDEEGHATQQIVLPDRVGVCTGSIDATGSLCDHRQAIALLLGGSGSSDDEEIFSSPSPSRAALNVVTVVKEDTEAFTIESLDALRADVAVVWLGQQRLVVASRAPIFGKKEAAELVAAIGAASTGADKKFTPRESLVARLGSTVQVPAEIRGTGQFDPSTLLSFELAAGIDVKDRVALADGSNGFTLSYAELFMVSDSVAAELIKSGVPAGGRVALSAEPSLWTIPCLLGILKAGCAYVPIHADYPEDRVRFIVDEAKLTHFIAPKAAQVSPREAQLATHFHSIIRVGRKFLKQKLDATQVAQVLERIANVRPCDPCSVLYTSGSTGKPKGVVNLHQGATNAVRASLDILLEATGGKLDRMLQSSTVSFDVSVVEIFCPLFHGATICVAPACVRSDPELLLKALADLQVDVVQLVPAPLEALLAVVEAGGDSARELVDGVRAICNCGEVLPVALVERARRVLPRTAHVNFYGPTEASIAVTAEILNRDESLSFAPIGCPFPGVTLSIRHVSDLSTVVGVGAVGEIVVSGIQLAEGYLCRRELTNKAFVNIGEGKPRIYRTGDLGRILADGRVQCLGRRDFQVKVRGLRIELCEIEEVASHCASVKRAIAVVCNEALVCAVTPEDADIAAVEIACRRALPRYAVPRVLAFASFPLLPNGKVDRHGVHKHVASAIAAATQLAHDPAATPTEVTVAAIWKSVGIEGAQDHVTSGFQDAGGSSFLAQNIKNRVEAEFGVVLPLRFFEFGSGSSVRAQAACIDEISSSGASTQSLPPLKPSAQELANTPTRVAYCQSRLVFMHELLPERPLYNIPIVTRTKALDIGRLHRVLVNTLRRHAALRSGFARENSGESVTFVTPVDACELPFHVHDLQDQPQALVVARVQDAVNHPFDITGREALLRCDVFKVFNRSEFIVLLNLHHLAADGHTMGLLAREIADAYLHDQESLPEVLPTGFEYRDFIDWQRSWLFPGSQAWEKQADWWKAELSGLMPTLSIPVDTPTSGDHSHAGDGVYFDLDRAPLAELGRRLGVSMHVLLISCFRAFLGLYSGQDDVVIGWPVANRRHADLEQVIGFFSNTLVLRARTEEATPFSDLVQLVREKTTGALENQDLPFDAIVDAAFDGEPPETRRPLFQSFFVLQNDPAYPRGLDLGPDSEVLDIWTQTSKFDFLLMVIDNDAQASSMRAYFEYPSDWVKRATAERMVSHFKALIEAVMSDPNQPLAPDMMMSDSERGDFKQRLDCEVGEGQLMVTASCVREEHVVHHLIDWAAHADNVAVVSRGAEDVDLSYAEVAYLSAKVAFAVQTALVGAKAGSGTMVGILCDGSAELPVFVLSVLRAGHAYVPLDPTLPDGRLGYIIRDSGLAAVLTTPSLAARATLLARQAVEREQGGSDDGEPASVLALSLEDARSLCLSKTNLLSVNRNSESVEPSDTAYVIYTSGTTGVPKGMLISHATLSNYLLHCRKILKFPSHGRMAQLSALGFDVHPFELFLPLLSGGAIVTIPRSAVTNLTELIHTHLLPGRVSATFMTPTFLRKLLAAECFVQCAEFFRALYVGGEAVTGTLLQATRLKLPSCRLYNAYGPSEVPFCAFYRTTDADDAVASVPIGRVIQNVTAVVVDSHDRPVPHGVIGELVIGGNVGVTDGYINRPELDTKFVRGVNGGRFFRTGDLVRVTSSGDLEFHGRRDGQVKWSGIRVELAELAAVLQRHSAVAHAAVAIKRDEATKRDMLVAYYVPAVGAVESVLTLRAHCRRHLAPAVCPTHFVALDAIPLTPNGKTDFRALRAPGPGDGERYKAPTTPTELKIAKIWEDMLGVNRVGVDDDFAQLGGTSMDAARLVARINHSCSALPSSATLANPLTVADFIAHPTVRLLAGVVDGGTLLGGEPFTEMVPRNNRGEDKLEPERLDVSWKLSSSG